MADDNEDIKHLRFKHASVRLDHLELAPLCHENLDCLSDEDLDDIIQALLLHGIPEVVEFYVDDQWRSIVVRGHRWVVACRLLANQSVAGFALSMEIEATQIVNASPQELLLRSADDPVIRFHLDYLGRMRVAHDLHEAGIPDERAATAMALPLEAYTALVERAHDLDA